MIQLTLYLLLAVTISKVTSFDGIQIGELKNATGEELKLILRYKDLVADCTGHPTPKNPKYLLYNRANPNEPTELTSQNLHLVPENKKLIVLIPGWLTKPTTSYIRLLKDQYFKRYDCSLIILDWTDSSMEPYTYIFCDVPRLGLQASKFLCQLSRTQNIPLSEVHVVGHSFGAHIAGYIGKNTDLQCDQKVGRITGLDPAGPLYKKLSTAQRLSKSDALFVDVIHTHFKLGIIENCGQADFHPNCVIEQPGCPIISAVNNTHLVSDAICDSLRSLEFMTESVNSNQLIGISCSLCSRYCSPDIINEAYAIMGEECREVPERKNFLIYTRSSSPYGQGMLPYARLAEFQKLP